MADWIISAPVAQIYRSGSCETASRDKTEIHVDRELFNQAGTRYRFSLAHEIAHMLLGHDKLLDKFISVDNWVEYFRDLPGDIYASIEYQANRLAGNILVPDDGLEEKFISYMQRFEGKNAPQLAKQDAAELILARDYAVNERTIHIRLRDMGLLKYPGQ